MQCQIDSGSPEATKQLGRQIGRRLKGGEVIELSSDLGGGKTTLVHGLADGFGSADRVASPTFTLSKVYKAGRRELHHFDFYRLQDPGILAYELQDLLDDPSVSLVIEWARIVHDVLPAERLRVELTRTGETTRTFTFSCPKELDYLVEDLC